MSQALHVVILAAGEGTRMKSDLPKVLQPLAGRPLLSHVLETARSLGPARTHVVYGSGGAAVIDAFAEYPDINWVMQEQRLGTGHAVKQALPDVPVDAQVMVLYADHPLVGEALLRDLLAAPAGTLPVITMELEDPTGYGRIVRDSGGRISAIVEEKDATDSQRGIREVNSGMLRADATQLAGWLDRITDDNVQREFYLTDIFALAHADGIEIPAVLAPQAEDLLGANDRLQLAGLERRYQQRQAERLLQQGVTLLDPSRVDIRGQVSAGRDVIIDINTVFEGQVELADGVRIGPGCVIRDCSLGPATEVYPHSVLDGVVTGKSCHIGPFARLRPGTRLDNEVRVGNFVETKQAHLGDGSKANHLSYLGDSEIGRQVNIGAGTITCNYDGANKHRTEIGDGAFIGSDSQLVAPVKVGEDATVGAGSTITKDVPAGELAVSRSRQTTVKGWKRPKKKG